MNIKTIIPKDLKCLLLNNEVTLIDVREQYEYQEGYILGCTLIPLRDISIQEMPSTSKPIVFYCRAGKRSIEACIRILNENPKLDVMSLSGGIISWIQDDFEIVK